jgi:hypothetical protein
MSVLAYCVALPGSLAEPDNVNSFEVEGLVCYYAEIPRVNANATETALQFHRVNTALFAAAAILPFQFPTTAASLEELQQKVASQAAHLRAALQRLQNSVQFELTFSVTSPASTSSQTGTEYLRQSQARERQLAEVLAQVRSSAGSYVLQWKERERGRDRRLFALVERRFQQVFSQVLQSLALPNGVECRVVGAWPATEFVDQ